MMWQHFLKEHKLYKDPVSIRTGDSKSESVPVNSNIKKAAQPIIAPPSLALIVDIPQGNVLCIICNNCSIGLENFQLSDNFYKMSSN